jgi:hypothetical protein
VEGKVDPAAGIAEVGAAGGAVDLAELLLERVNQATELGLEAAVAGRGLAQLAAAEPDQALAGIVPADQGLVISAWSKAPANRSCSVMPLSSNTAATSRLSVSSPDVPVTAVRS